jgi:AcrR family transcriptional regulator
MPRKGPLGILCGTMEAPEQTPPRRGRPRKTQSPAQPPGLDVADPLVALPPTARHILGAAQRLVIERGYQALTIEAVALESGETPHSVFRHFGSKAGLVEAVLDAAVHDAYVRLLARVGDMPPGEERLTAYIEGLGDLVKDTEATVLTFRIAPHALTDPVLRARIAVLYRWYRELTLRESGIATDQALDRLPPEERRRRLESIGAVVLAAVDGLALQAALDPDGFDADAAFAELARMVRGILR